MHVFGDALLRYCETEIISLNKYSGDNIYLAYADRHDIEDIKIFMVIDTYVFIWFIIFHQLKLVES